MASTTAPVSESQAPSPPARKTSLLARLIQVAAVAGFALLGWQLVGNFAGEGKYPDPPAIPSPIPDPAVAREVQGATDRVKAAKYSPTRWGLLGMTYQVHEYFAEARTAFVVAARLDPNNPLWPYYLGRSYAGGEPQKAAEYLRASVRLSGTDSQSASLLLAEVLLDLGETAEAEKIFSRVLQERPSDPRILFGLGRIAADRGNLEEARQYFEQVVQKAPTYKGGFTRLAIVYKRLGVDDLSAAAAARASELGENEPWPDPYLDTLNTMKVGLGADLNRIFTLVSKGEIDRALPIGERLVKDYPNDSGAWSNLGAMYLQMNRPVDAERALRSSLKIAPNVADTLTLLASALRGTGRSQEAEPLLRQAVQLQPNSVDAHFMLGLALGDQGNIAAAVAPLEKAVELNPTKLEARAALIEAYQALGRNQDVQAQVQAIRRYDPSYPGPEPVPNAPPPSPTTTPSAP